MTTPPASYSIFKEAEIVIRARVTGYEKPRRYRSVLHFDVVEVLPNAPTHRFNKISAYWTNSTFGMPDRWDGPTDVIVGLRAEIDQGGVPVIEVVQQPCGPMTILEDTQGNLTAISEAIGLSR
ncbi:hypothetical protein GCM10023067_23280 [Aminobacter aganoensis]